MEALNKNLQSEKSLALKINDTSILEKLDPECKEKFERQFVAIKKKIAKLAKNYQLLPATVNLYDIYFRTYFFN